MKKVAYLILVVILILGTSTAFASIAPVDGAITMLAESDVYPVRVTGKVLDGADTVVGAPLELIEHPYKEVILKGDYVKGLFTGIYRGTTHTLDTAFDGVLRIIKAPFAMK